MEKDKNKKTFKKIRKVLGIILDVILYPVIIVSLFVSVTSLTAKGRNKLNTFFGYGVVTVLTGSMLDAGFDINEIVFLQPYEADELRPTFYKKDGELVTEGTLRSSHTHIDESYELISEGSVIAFYQYVDSEDPEPSEMTKIIDFELPPEITSEQSVVGDKTIDDAANNQALVIFHRVIDVYFADDGTRFFVTKGDSNSTTDGAIIREDFVVGQYMYTPPVMSDTIAFLSTTQGLLYGVVAPLAVLVFVQIVEVMILLFAILTERKVLSGEIPFDSEESIKAEVGKEMRSRDKIYFYDITDDNRKEDVTHFLWGHLTQEKSTDKERKQFKQIQISLDMYEKSRDEYWRFWISGETSARKKRRLLALQRIANIRHKGKQHNIDMTGVTKTKTSKSNTNKKTPKIPVRPAKAKNDKGEFVLPLKKEPKTKKSDKKD